MPSRSPNTLNSANSATLRLRFAPSRAESSRVVSELRSSVNIPVSEMNKDFEQGLASALPPQLPQSFGEMAENTFNVPDATQVQRPVPADHYALAVFKNTNELLVKVVSHLPPENRANATIAFAIPPMDIATCTKFQQWKHLLQRPEIRIRLQRQVSESLQTSPDSVVDLVRLAKVVPFAYKDSDQQAGALAPIFVCLDNIEASYAEDPKDMKEKIKGDIQHNQINALNMLSNLCNGLALQNNLSVQHIDEILRRLPLHMKAPHHNAFRQNYRKLVSSLTYGLQNGALSTRHITPTLALINEMLDDASGDGLTDIVVTMSNAITKKVLDPQQIIQAQNLLTHSVRLLQRVTKSSQIVPLLHQIRGDYEGHSSHDDWINVEAIALAISAPDVTDAHMVRLISLLPESMVNALSEHVSRTLENGELSSNALSCSYAVDLIALFSSRCSPEINSQAILSLAVALSNGDIQIETHSKTFNCMLQVSGNAEPSMFRESNEFMQHAIANGKIQSSVETMSVMNILSVGAKEYRDLDRIAFLLRQLQNRNTGLPMTSMYAAAQEAESLIRGLPSASQKNTIDVYAAELGNALRSNKHHPQQGSAMSSLLRAITKDTKQHRAQFFDDDFLRQK